MGPIKLLSVSEETRGKNRAIILKFNVGGEEKEVGCSFQEGYEDRKRKCESFKSWIFTLLWEWKVSLSLGIWSILPTYLKKNHPPLS